MSKKIFITKKNINKIANAITDSQANANTHNNLSNPSNANNVSNVDNTVKNVETIILKDKNILLDDIISSYVNKNISLPDIIKLEALNDKQLQLDIITCYTNLITQYIEKIHIEKIIKPVVNAGNIPTKIDSNNLDDEDEITNTDGDDEDSNEDNYNIGDSIDEIPIIFPENENIIKEIDKYRYNIQKKYIDDAISILCNDDGNKKVLIKGPTGFGKTVINYKLINYFSDIDNITLILTPRRLLNVQTIDKEEKKYIKHLENGEHYMFHNYCPETGTYSNSNRNKSLNRFITTAHKKNKKSIILSCYQSLPTLLNYFIETSITIDMCICDEAHFINSWGDLNEDYQKIFFNIPCITIPSNNASNDIIKKYIFTTATPYPDMTINTQLWGTLIEYVQIYELIENKVLCDFEVLVKKGEFENQKIDIGNYCIKVMTDKNKRKGVIYMNTRDSAYHLYVSMKYKNPNYPLYLYISGGREFKIDSAITGNIKHFKDNKNPAIIITVNKIGFGYDDVNIDMICFGEARTSQIDIRQILGRGLRNNIILYPGKILHVILMITKPELLPTQTIEDINKIQHYYKNIKNFLEFIINECGKDIIKGYITNSLLNNNINNADNSSITTAETVIIACDGVNTACDGVNTAGENVITAGDDVNIAGYSSRAGDNINTLKEKEKEKNKLLENNMEFDIGDKIPYEICRELCTTLYGKYSKFIGYLRQNGIYDETTYNLVRERENQPEWMPILGDIRKRFKKFCFQDIKAPENKEYYENWEDCKKIIIKHKNELINEIGGLIKVKKMLKTIFNEKLRTKIYNNDSKVPNNIYLFYYDDDIDNYKF